MAARTAICFTRNPPHLTASTLLRLLSTRYSERPCALNSGFLSCPDAGSLLHSFAPGLRFEYQRAMLVLKSGFWRERTMLDDSEKGPAIAWMAANQSVPRNRCFRIRFASFPPGFASTPPSRNCEKKICSGKGSPFFSFLC